MASGGIYQLITNDGKQDKMLMASDVLKKRLDDIEEYRSTSPDYAGEDPTPTLADIERTHILFMNAHFKPFVAIGFEYYKVRLSATITLDSTNTTPVQYSIPQFGDFFSDMVLNAKLSPLTVTLNAESEFVGDPAELYDDETYDGDYIFYCDYPGERLLYKTKFSVHGNELDSYDRDFIPFYREFKVGPTGTGKRIGWDRCVGQESVHSADLVTDATSQTREWRYFSFGHQTPRWEQPALDLWIPILFWFNLDSRLAIPSVSIPYGQRFLEIELSPAQDLIFLMRNPNTLIPDALVDSYTVPTFQALDLYINNIFVNPEIHAIFIKRIGFNLIRVHKWHTEAVSQDSGSKLLQNLKFPIEYLMFGLRPKTNVSLSNDMVARDWHRYTNIAYQVVVDPAVEIRVYQQTVDTISLSAHSVQLYRDTPAKFFHSYTPWAYGGTNIHCPEDIGKMFMPFCLYPGLYQPSSHINVSRSREFYLDYKSSIISGENPGDLIIYASAINFLLISDGAAVLRYAT